MPHYVSENQPPPAASGQCDFSSCGAPEQEALVSEVRGRGMALAVLFMVVVVLHTRVAGVCR